MYQFIVNNEIVGYAATPSYIKKLDNGCYGLCSESEATGVAVAGTPYRLDGKELDELPIVELKKMEDSEFFSYVMQVNEAVNILGVETEEVTDDAE